MQIVRHTTPVYDVSAIIEALKKDMVISNCPEGEAYITVDNIYIELVEGKPKLRVWFDIPE